MKIEFYTTLGCHLCEDALALLHQLDIKGLTIIEIEISDSDKLVEAYGIRIPVIKFTTSEHELSWPFNISQLQDFVSTNQ